MKYKNVLKSRLVDKLKKETKYLLSNYKAIKLSFKTDIVHLDTKDEAVQGDRGSSTAIRSIRSTVCTTRYTPSIFRKYKLHIYVFSM